MPRIHRVAIIGDSFTEGSGEGGLGSRSWPEVLRHDLLATGFIVDLNVAAEGNSGYMTPGHGGNVFGDSTDVLGDGNDLVIFFGGVNDGDSDAVALEKAVGDTLTKARTSAPRAKFLVIGPAWPSGSPPDAVIETRDVIRNQADRSGIEFVDPIAERWFVGAPELIGVDGVHPNDRGHEYLAEKIAVLVRRAFGVGPR